MGERVSCFSAVISGWVLGVLDCCVFITFIRIICITAFYRLFHNMAMNCRIDDVMGLCCKISEDRKIKATVQNSAKGGVTAGGGAFIGGLLGGPPGIFFGMIMSNFLQSTFFLHYIF